MLLPDEELIRKLEEESERSKIEPEDKPRIVELKRAISLWTLDYTVWEMQRAYQNVCSEYLSARQKFE
jgi:hypothetical protein